MKTTKDPTGLITQDSIIVAPQELNDDASWTLIQSKKTRKERQKAKEKNLTAFPPLPSIQEDMSPWSSYQKNPLPQASVQ